MPRGCATGRLNILALVLNRGSAIDKAVWGRFTSAGGDEQGEQTYLAKVTEVARVVLVNQGSEIGIQRRGDRELVCESIAWKQE